jgi:hypothetical protein
MNWWSFFAALQDNGRSGWLFVASLLGVFLLAIFWPVTIALIVIGLAGIPIGLLLGASRKYLAGRPRLTWFCVAGLLVIGLMVVAAVVENLLELFTLM